MVTGPDVEGQLAVLKTENYTVAREGIRESESLVVCDLLIAGPVLRNHFLNLILIMIVCR